MFFVILQHYQQVVLNLFAHGSFNGFSYKGKTSGSTGEKSVKFFYDMIQKDRGLKESYSKSYYVCKR